MSRSRQRQESTEFVKFGSFEASTRIEALHARFDRHEFATHAHDTWAIGAVISGAKDIFGKKGTDGIIRSTQVYSLPPHRAHGGKTVGSACEYVMLYVPVEEWTTQCDARGVDIHRFSHGALEDARLTQCLLSFVTLMLHHPERLSEWSGEWTNFCEVLLHRYRTAERTTSPAGAIRADPDLVRAYDFLHEYWNCNVSLDKLAGESAMSIYELCRRFSAVYGLSPHRYQLVLRLEKAKAKLLRGASISDVAADTGFADQSHLGRHFKSMFGMTPGAVLEEAASKKKRRSGPECDEA
ncbi:AraC family transcriptional regulator [Caballeronia terrestris]|uniref:AraC family transcriptional regulator n=1 Tax=Caballeronia terrestris TaxID=1226301 RepID=UPI000B3EB4BB|nr:AraC family transcriptional regulator [Caballeronia terrestris]